MQFFRKIKMMSRPVSPSEDIRPTFRSAVGAWVRRNRAWRPGDHARDCADRPPPSAATLHDDSIEQLLDRALEQRPDLLQQLEGVKAAEGTIRGADRKSTRLNSSHQITSYAVFCLKKINTTLHPTHTSITSHIGSLPIPR